MPPKLKKEGSTLGPTKVAEALEAEKAIPTPDSTPRTEAALVDMDETENVKGSDKVLQFTPEVEEEFRVEEEARQLAMVAEEQARRNWEAEEATRRAWEEEEAERQRVWEEEEAERQRVAEEEAARVRAAHDEALSAAMERRELKGLKDAIAASSEASSELQKEVPPGVHGTLDRPHVDHTAAASSRARRFVCVRRRSCKNG